MRKSTIKIIFPFSLLLFLAFNFQGSNPPSNWYQQFMPNLNGRYIRDMIFTDTLTGYSITNGSDTNYILKTTNSGDNWNIITTIITNPRRIQFINPNTGFVCGTNSGGGVYLQKTTNGGINWFSITTGFGNIYSDMAVVNDDTIFIADENGLTGGVYRTTNKGLNWNLMQSFGGANPNKIYMYNSRIGFLGETFSLRKTTNGGINWFTIPNEKNFYCMRFINDLTGWKSADSMKKSTDGGLTWKRQYIPIGGNISEFGTIVNFKILNLDTIWGAGGKIQTGFNQYKGFLYFSSNGGNNWTYQIPDTSFNISQFAFIDFKNKRNGWAYLSNGIHTTTGGDTTFLTGIKQISTEIPNSFTLKQNYPNPFNPKTIIRYELKENAFVKMAVFDINGKEVQKLINQRQNVGSYEVDFSGQFLSSGVYFYKIEVTTNKGSFIDSKKMLLIK